MASYADKDDIIQYHGSRILEIVSDRDEADDDDETADATIELALESASSEANSYLSGRYAVPIETPPLVLVRVVVDIAVYRMAYTTTSLTEEMRKRFEDAVAWLKLVAKGDVEVEGATPPGGSDGDDNSTVAGGRRAGFFFSGRG